MKKEQKIFKVSSEFMLRTAMLPLESLNKVETNQEHFLSLEKFLEDGFMREALLIASPALSAMLKKDKLKQKEEKKVAASLFKYISRTFSRATPFGLFASVGMGEFGKAEYIPKFEELNIKKHSRIDMEWLLGFIHQLEQNPRLVSQLKVKTNHAIRTVGNRLELLFPTYCGQGEKLKNGKTDTISVRLTAASKFVLEKAQTPILFTKLVHETYEKYNREIEITVLSNFIWELFRQEFLVSELRPPLLGGQPIEYLLEKLANISEIENEIKVLKQVESMVDAYDDLEIGKGTCKYFEIDQELQSVLTSKSSLQIDTSFSNRVSINTSVADSLEDAAEVMWRISTTSKGFPYMRDYYLTFIGKYGTAADVPLLELVDANIGLGYPEHYSNGQQILNTPKTEQDKLSKRRSVLSEKIATSIMNGFSEVVLDENLIDKLTIRDNWKCEMPDSMEIYAEVIATNREELEKGAHTIVINPSAGSFQMGLSLGRFTEVMGEETQDTLRRISKRNQELNENIILVDATYIPVYGRTANIMMSKNFLPHEMAIGTNVQDGKQEVELNDLYVSADNERLFLKSKKYGREVVVVASNMLNFVGSPNLFRFLKDLSFENKYYWQPFEWAVGTEQVYLPRLRYKNVIFTPAQWNLNKSLFEQDHFRSEEQFFVAFQNWAKKWKVPKYVFVKIADNHILLDLSIKESINLLMKDIENGSSVKLEELVGKFNERVLVRGEKGHYMTEVVFEVEATNRKKRAGENYPTIKYDLRGNDNFFPCEEWLYVNLYGLLNVQNEFLINTLAPFADGLVHKEMIQQWFFIRFEDTKPHIRLRFQLNNKCKGESLLNQVLNWLKMCKKNGEVFEATIQPYEREQARYGGPQFISDAERVFCYDSQTAIKLLNIFKNKEMQEQIFVGALGAINILRELGLSEKAQLELLDNYVGKDKYKHDFRKMKANFFAALSDVPNEKCMNCEIEVLNAFGNRAKELNAYGEKLNKSGDMLWNELYDIVSSLLHMSFNRLFGIDREKEERCLSLARHTIHALMQYEKHTNRTA